MTPPTPEASRRAEDVVKEWSELLKHAMATQQLSQEAENIMIASIEQFATRAVEGEQERLRRELREASSHTGILSALSIETIFSNASAPKEQP
jgi:hypothetical protein